MVPKPNGRCHADGLALESRTRDHKENSVEQTLSLTGRGPGFRDHCRAANKTWIGYPYRGRKEDAWKGDVTEGEVVRARERPWGGNHEISRGKIHALASGSRLQFQMTSLGCSVCIVRSEYLGTD